MNRYKIVEIGKKRFKNSNSQIVHFVENNEANILLNDLNNYPHAFVLACLMDRQVKAEKAWMIPFQIKQFLGSFDIKTLSDIKIENYKKLFYKHKLHRFPETMAEIFYYAIIDIKNKYEGNASKIWRNKPSSSTVVYRFLEFKGSGIKIATMAANILARQFRIQFSDYYSIDISTDIHIRRVMKRMGFIPRDATNDMIIYKARELNPEFPGIIDFSCWEIGRTWCKPNKPDCKNCIVNKDCKKVLDDDI